MMTAAEAVRIAQDEVGYLEKATNSQLDDKLANPGTGSWTKYARDLWEADPHYFQGPKNGMADWCSIFVAWCLYMAAGRDSAKGQMALCYNGPYGASCTYAANYFKEAGRFIQVRPHAGDQIFFQRNGQIVHTGLVEKVDPDGVIHTIEGNSSNAVRRQAYGLGDARIYGFGRPRYEEELPCPFTDLEPKSYYEEAARELWRLGIVKGTTGTTFEPGRNITRAEVATMLWRTIKYLKED